MKKKSIEIVWFVLWDFSDLSKSEYDTDFWLRTNEENARELFDRKIEDAKGYGKKLIVNREGDMFAEVHDEDYEIRINISIGKREVKE